MYVCTSRREDTAPRIQTMCIHYKQVSPDLYWGTTPLSALRPVPGGRVSTLRREKAGTHYIYYAS